MSDTTARATVFRPLRETDLPEGAKLTASFGWPHRLEDWQFMLARGEGIAAERDGTLVGTGMAWRYGDDWAAIGMINVAPAAQRQGLGRQIIQRVLAPLAGRSVLLHATEAGLKLYRAYGFVEEGVVRQLQGAAFNAGLVALPEGERLRPVGRNDTPVLKRLDRAAAGMDRGAMLDAILPNASGIILDRGGEAIGFALIRRFGRGQVIGPVIAPDAERARALIGHFLASRHGEFTRIDVPESTGLCPWLMQLGLDDAGPAIRMTRGTPAGGEGIFALISQAFG